jgi:hypothetical protein
MKEAGDIERAKQQLAAIEEQQRQLEEELRGEIVTIESSSDAATEKLEPVAIKAKKTHVTVTLVALVWSSTIGE